MGDRITDWHVPTVLDANQTGDKDKPWQASCPKGDFTGRPTTTEREAREQQTRHWAREHYHLDNPGDWGLL